MVTIADLIANPSIVENGQLGEEWLVQGQILQEQIGQKQIGMMGDAAFYAPTIQDEKPQEIDLTGLEKRFVETVNRFRIFLVDGEFVRNRLETDFTLASHWVMSKFIPKNEIWVDCKMSNNDKIAVIHHEIYEVKLMVKGMPYEEAHRRATISEKIFRKNNFK